MTSFLNESEVDKCVKLANEDDLEGFEKVFISLRAGNKKEVLFKFLETFKGESPDIYINIFLNEKISIYSPSFHGDLHYFLPLLNNFPTDIISLFIEKGVDLNHREGRIDNTFLHNYLQNTKEDLFIRLEKISLLIKYGFDVNSVNDLRRSILFYCKTPEEVALLAKSGCNLDLIDIESKSFIMNTQDKYLIRSLIENGADPNKKGKYGRTALFYSTSEEVIEELINGGADVNYKDMGGNTPLMTLIHQKSSEELVKFLIEKGAKIDIKNLSGNNLLSRCILSLDIFIFLLENGLEITPKIFSYTIPNLLKVSRPIEQLQTLRRFIDFNELNSEGFPLCLKLITDKLIGLDTAIHLGIDLTRKYGPFPPFLNLFFNTYENSVISERTPSLLKSLGININTKDECNRTIFHMMVLKNYSPKEIKSLIDIGLDPFEKCMNGNNILHIAFMHNINDSVIDYLLTLGVDINEINHEGNTPYRCAYICGKYLSKLKTLEKLGADPFIGENNNVDFKEIIPPYYKYSDYTRLGIQADCLIHLLEKGVYMSDEFIKNAFHLEEHGFMRGELQFSAYFSNTFLGIFKKLRFSIGEVKRLYKTYMLLTRGDHLEKMKKRYVELTDILHKYMYKNPTAEETNKINEVIDLIMSECYNYPLVKILSEQRN